VTARRFASVLSALALVAAGLVLALNGASPGAPAAYEALARARSFTVTASLSRTSVLRNERVVLSGTVRPVRTTKKVLVQHKGADGWTTVARRSLNDDGAYRYAFKAKESGDQAYRARMPKAGAVRAGTSPQQVLTVADEALVVFKIPGGTGASDWNTAGTTVTAEVGDTLRIVNNDLMAHRPHTDGDPFPHPAEDIQPGGSADYVLKTAYDSAAGHTLYCHIHGPSSHFWLDVVEP